MDGALLRKRLLLLLVVALLLLLLEAEWLLHRVRGLRRLIWWRRLAVHGGRIAEPAPAERAMRRGGRGGIGGVRMMVVVVVWRVRVGVVMVQCGERTVGRKQNGGKL